MMCSFRSVPCNLHMEVKNTFTISVLITVLVVLSESINISSDYSCKSIVNNHPLCTHDYVVHLNIDNCECYQ